MSATGNSLRQRGGQNPKKTLPALSAIRDDELNGVVKARQKGLGSGSEWDYKLSLVVITALAFVTRFWGIGHPNEVVFDEVHFGKVRCTKHAVGTMISRASSRSACSRELLLEADEGTCLSSSHRITFKERISLMCILLSGSSYLP